MPQTLDQIEFLKESDRLKLVLRKCLVHDGSRLENTAEHSWQLALATMTCVDLADEKIDLARALQMALIHDLVEIGAGDTFVYDEKAAEGKFARELQAANQLYALLPGRGDELRALWLEYEQQACPESRYVNALDRFLPVLANCMTGGHAWRENGISKSRVLAKNAPIEKGSQKLWQVAQAMIEDCAAKGFLSQD